jgi:hypothetical protein
MRHMHRHEGRKANKSNRVHLDLDRLPELVDACFGGITEADEPNHQHGWVAMAANKQGGRAINAVFPDIHIEWRFHNDCRWLGWGEFSLNVADVAHTTRNHRLPIEIVRTADLDAATPEALAFLLAMAAKREGVRVACESEGRLTIYASRHNNLHAARHVALATAS